MGVVVYLANWVVTHTIPPRLCPRLDFRSGIPQECRTLVALPVILTSAREVRNLLRQVELHYLGNADPHLVFALLTDFSDAPQEHMPEDEGLLEQLKAAIDGLNAQYGQGERTPFLLLHRGRTWNPKEETWMGWERKRGKLVQLDRLLLGRDQGSLRLHAGDSRALAAMKYVITLDADTVLPRGSAARLIATLAHPLNRAEFDPSSGKAVAGYTVLQPRLEISPTSANWSLFSRVFAPWSAGLDLYSRAMSDVYQDLFGEGIYAGKGIYDIAAFERSLAGRMPENALLSHDLFEGLHGRAGLVADVTLIEDYPPNYLTYARRLDRWARGDWQLLPWLLPTVPDASGGRRPNDLSLLNRWKIFDNLRRSLHAPALLALLIAGWLWLPGSPFIWTLTGLLTSALPIGDVLGRWLQALRGEPLARTAHSFWAGLLRWLLALAFLPYESLIMLDAMGTTLVRLTITHWHMLRWTTAAHTIRFFGRETKLAQMWRSMGSATLLSATVGLLLGTTRIAALPLAAPLLLLWIASPLAAHWISRPFARAPAPLSDEQHQHLRRLARRTWLFFEQFVGPEDHWLPPDHFQEDPRGLVAHRTSPTNIGLALLSTLAAHDLGYLSWMDLALRLRDGLENLGKLAPYRGHFLNWYDTHSLQPLPPRYVSTVDSGNLAASLLALRQGCLALPRSPVLSWPRWQGFLDTLGILAETVEQAAKPELEPWVGQLRDHLGTIQQRVLAAQEDLDAWPALLAWLSGEGWQRLDQLLISLVESDAALETEALRGFRTWSERAHYHLVSMQRDLDMFLPWLRPFSQPSALFTRAETDPQLLAAWQAVRDSLPAAPRLEQVAEACKTGQKHLVLLEDLLTRAPDHEPQIQEARQWCQDLAQGLAEARLVARAVLIGLQELSVEAESMFRRMDFTFLLDAQRQVFHIGYNVDAGKLDDSYYDLLASEARIASLIAIAKRDASQSHWLHLARPITRIDGSRMLLSWNGSMFEYLMPSLLVRSYEGTLLEQSSRAAVDRQIAYGRQNGLPWGVSESGYYRFDANMNYQYRGFGVPGLGLKRGLADDLVISPYASLLALHIHPQAVMSNLGQLVSRGILGRFGLYEAIDFTPSRQPPGRKGVIVRSYMAHHQGMILQALANYLHSDGMVARFHADPRVQSVELLLQEQVPWQAPVEVPHPSRVSRFQSLQPRITIKPWRVPATSPLPHVHVLSNGRLSVVLTNAGGGFLRWQDLDLTRWRADATLDAWGLWIYIQDLESGALWSATPQPTDSPSSSHTISFSAPQAEYLCRDRGLSVQMEICVSPDDDVEIRRLTVKNEGLRRRRLMLTSYGEPVLAAQAADRRHPGFNKLFIESEYIPEVNALLFRRRPVSAEEKPIYLVHGLATGPEAATTGAHESDRSRFLGRRRTPRLPLALSADGHGLSGTTGAVLDPIMALGQEIELTPYGTTQITFLTLAASSRQEALTLARRYQAGAALDRAFERARAQSELELRQLGLDSMQLENVQRLLALLLYPNSALRASPATLAANRKGQAGLWAYGISGDNPVLLVRLADEEETRLLVEVLQAHAFWRRRQVRIDLVVLNDRETGYGQEFHAHLRRLINQTYGEVWLDKGSGVFLLLADQMGKTDLTLLETVAGVILKGKRGSLAEQLEPAERWMARPPRLIPSLAVTQEAAERPLGRPSHLLFDNGLGGFAPDGREYLIYLEPGQWTPHPWVNIVGYPHFGFLVSESGGGFTWAENSGENRLTPWNNDPVSDTPGEALYLRDEETGEVWSPTLLPTGAPAPYLIRHGAGYSIFEHHSHGLIQNLRLFAAPDAPLKVVQLRLQNARAVSRRVTATFYAEWVLGTSRDTSQAYVLPDFDPETYALLASNTYSAEFAERVAFLAASSKPYSLTADRAEFLGRTGSLSHPAALERVGLGGVIEPGGDPCAAIQINVELAPDEAKEVFFLLGQGVDRADSLRLIREYQDPRRVIQAWEAVHAFWDQMLGCVQVRTPDLAMDLLLNRWLLYQTLSSRLWGRTGLYQPGGAYGYRDQLQDAMALVHCAPHILRDHLLLAAQHQFEEGDVLHWWHPPSGRGVRTRCSDDLLWLPFVTGHYVKTTGDEGVLTEKRSFLKGEPLGPDESERYGLYQPSPEVHTLYEHCRRALHKGTTAGPHGLPLIGSGDWSDGLNRMGLKGRGESVWLGWFLEATLADFLPLSDRMADEEHAGRLRQQIPRLAQELETHAWDGGWYRRAYDDDGNPMGSAQNRECRIDSIAQSWAVLSGAAEASHTAQAMNAVAELLVRPDEALVLLFAPPFDKTPQGLGYIQGYPPGIRENGGQYAHAAVWAAWAFAELGQGDQAEAIFRMLSPISRSDSAEKARRYRVEPYVMAADVYSMSPHIGRGGWTWYTGSAAWMYRLGLEIILGIKRQGNRLIIRPCIPAEWAHYRLTYRHDETSYDIQVDNPDGVNRAVRQVTLDGKILPDDGIPLTNDGKRHAVRVLLGVGSPAGD
jgi:cyclic beta-1,2-glucan synthetase